MEVGPRGPDTPPITPRSITVCSDDEASSDDISTVSMDTSIRSIISEHVPSEDGEGFMWPQSGVANPEPDDAHTLVRRTAALRTHDSFRRRGPESVAQHLLLRDRQLQRIEGRATAQLGEAPGELIRNPVADDADLHIHSIQENDGAAVHDRDSLSAIVGHYNSVLCDQGPIGALLQRATRGQAYSDVPDPTLALTSRPWTAIHARKSFSLFLFLAAIMLLWDLHSLRLPGAVRRMSWLKVDHVKFYENPFPDFATGGNVAGNRRLAMIDAGVYIGSHYRLLADDQCNKTITSDSFEMVCTWDIDVHGIWFLVSGSTRGQGTTDGHVAPFYDYAGVEYAYSIGAHGNPGSTERQPPHDDDMSNVMGTGQVLRGKVWEVLASDVNAEGIFRLPVAPLPVSSRPWHAICNIAFTIPIALMLCCAAVLGLMGCNGAAKYAVAMCFMGTTIWALFIAVGLAWMLADPAAQDALPLVRVGLVKDVRLDIHCDRQLSAAVRCVDRYGLNTAYWIVALAACEVLVWSILSGVVLFEKSIVVGGFSSVWLLVCLQLTAYALDSDLYSKNTVYFIFMCLPAQVQILKNARTERLDF